MNIIRAAVLGVLLSAAMLANGQDNQSPVRVAVVGLNYDHAYGSFPQLRGGGSDVELAGVAETNHALNLEVAAKIEKGKPVTAPAFPRIIPTPRNW